MEVLQKLIDEVDLLISQHAIYISRLEKAIKKGIEFDSKDCDSCNLGLLLNQIEEDGLPEEIGKEIKEIKNIHCHFHEKAKEELENKSTDVLKEVSDISTELFRNLLKLRKLLKTTTSLN